MSGAQQGRVLAALAVALLAAGCGLKSDLYLEEPPVSATPMENGTEASASTAQPEQPEEATADAPPSAAESLQQELGAEELSEENSLQETPSQEKPPQEKLPQEKQ